MKHTYTVTLKVADRSAVIDIIDAVKGKATSIEISNGAPETEAGPRVTLAPPRPPIRKESKERKLRGSKVNEALLGAMSDGPASNEALKAALEKIGRSASSLSTGLRALTMSGKIERVGEGLYGLKKAA